jgi:hypothetical protein
MMKKTIIVRAKNSERFLRNLNMTAEAVMLLVDDVYREHDSITKAGLYASIFGSAWCDDEGWNHLFMMVPLQFSMKDYERLCDENEFIKEPPTSEEIIFGEFRK